MTQTRNSWFARLCGGLRRAWRSGKSGEGDGNAGHGLNDRGLLVFAHTGEVIRAERALREAGFTVEVKGPPPRLRTGCDMVVVFPLLSQAAVLKRLKLADIEPEQVVSAHDVLLEPVSLFQTKRLGRWLMVRAANMKITIDTADERIVNISGGGCRTCPGWLKTCAACGFPKRRNPCAWDRRSAATVCKRLLRNYGGNAYVADRGHCS